MFACLFKDRVAMTCEGLLPVNVYTLCTSFHVKAVCQSLDWDRSAVGPRRRNELILRKEKTEADERLQNSLIVATKNLGRSLSFVECNAPEETPGRDITLMDIGGVSSNCTM